MNNGEMTMKKGSCLYIVVMLVLIFTPNSFAQTISARFTTAAYTWEQQESDTATANHLRAYQLAQLSIGNFGLKNLSFHTYLQLSNDFVEQAKDDPSLWIYNFYFDYKKLLNAVDLSVGRQRIYAGVGYGTVDGLQLKYGFRDYFQFKAYIGTLAPVRTSTEIQDFKSENLSYGFHLTTNKLKLLKIGLSYTNLSREPVRYKTTGLFTGNFRLNNPESATQKQLMGLDMSSLVSKNIRINGRLDFNLLTEKVQRGEFGGRYFTKNFEAGLDFIYRMPYLDYNSIFSVFAYNANQEVEFYANYRMGDHRIYGNFSTVMFEGDDNQRMSIGWNWKFINIGYNKRMGYGGESDGFYATLNHFVMDKLNFSLSSNFVSFKYDAIATDRDQVLAEVIGINYTPKKNLTLQAEAQYLTNPRFSHDIRLFFRGSYALFHRF
jgi:hypothetical protein